VLGRRGPRRKAALDAFGRCGTQVGRTLRFHNMISTMIRPVVLSAD
jgi:hypothetical protein